MSESEKWTPRLRKFINEHWSTSTKLTLYYLILHVYYRRFYRHVLGVDTRSSGFLVKQIIRARVVHFRSSIRRVKQSEDVNYTYEIARKLREERNLR
jgi:hypothetical protein